MKNGMLIGLAVGTAMGMFIAAKNNKVVKTVNEAESAIKSKLSDMGSNQASQADN